MADLVTNQKARLNYEILETFEELAFLHILVRPHQPAEGPAIPGERPIFEGFGIA